MKYYNTSLGNCAAPSSGVYQVSNTLIRKPPLVRAPCTAIGIAALLSARSIHPSPHSGYVRARLLRREKIILRPLSKPIRKLLKIFRFENSNNNNTGRELKIRTILHSLFTVSTTPLVRARRPRGRRIQLYWIPATPEKSERAYKFTTDLKRAKRTTPESTTREEAV